MMQLYDSFLGDELTEIEDQKLLADNPDFRNLLTEYKEGILLFTIMEKEVWNKGADDTLAIRKFYEANKSKYTAGDRVHARVFTTTDKNVIAEAKSNVEKGDSLRKDDLKKFKSISPFRNYARGESKAVDKVSWAIGLHSTESEGNYYLVEIDNLVPPGTKSLEESRAQIVGDRQDSLEKTWIKELKQKYPIKVNGKGKKFVVSELTKK
jgi:peptidyl-prolyl cis-trans isomerase SurA